MRKSRQLRKAERRSFSSVFQDIFNWLAVKASAKQTVNGMVIVFSKHKGSEAPDRVAAALQLIRDLDPVRYRRVVRDLKRIWITTIAGAAGRFVNSTSTCELDERFVLGEHTLTEHVASVIVHEATHARLHQWGIGYEEELRHRVEWVCMRRELAFAAKLPDGASIPDWIVAGKTEPADFSNTAMIAREIDNAREALLQLNAPAWLADTIVFFARRRQQRRVRRQEAERLLKEQN